MKTLGCVKEPRLHCLAEYKRANVFIFNRKKGKRVAKKGKERKESGTTEVV
jgi:hypothetical protein